MKAQKGSRTAAFQRNQRASDPSPGPWTKWRGSRVGRFIRFAETYLRLPRGPRAGELVELWPAQKAFFEEWLEGRYSAGIHSMGRGGSKSTDMAMMAAFDAFEGESQGAPVVPIVAVSLGQARSSVYSQIVSMVLAAPELKNRSLVFSGMGTERILIPRSGGVIVPRAADADTLQGLDIWPGGYVDEVGHISQATWDAILLGRKRSGARILGAGTWGPDTNSPLYQLRKMVREGNAPADFLWRVHTGEPGAAIADERNWYPPNPNLKYGMPDLAALRQDAVMTPEASFRTYRLNEPDVVGHDSWLGPEARTIWDALTNNYTLDITKPTYVGVDVGIYFDCTAVVCVQERTDGRLHAVAKIWTPIPGRTVDIAEIVGYLRMLGRSLKVCAIAYDPRLFELPAGQLEAEQYPMVKIDQTTETMTPIVGALFERIQRGALTHNRDDLFAAHVINAVPRVNERGFTLSKSRSAPRGHIDACIALALAVDRWAHQKPTHGVWVG